jgi:hypothetical protein
MPSQASTCTERKTTNHTHTIRFLGQEGESVGLLSIRARQSYGGHKSTHRGLSPVGYPTAIFPLWGNSRAILGHRLSQRHKCLGAKSRESSMECFPCIPQDQNCRRHSMTFLFEDKQMSSSCQVIGAMFLASAVMRGGKDQILSQGIILRRNLDQLDLVDVNWSRA